MPTTRRSTSGARGRGAVAAGKGQKKLSFNQRVSKPVQVSAKDSVASSPLKKELIREHIEKDDDVENVQPDEQQIVGKDVPKSDIELKAAKVSDAAVQKYWRKVEAERMGKRVHQEDLTISEKVLRYFDVSSHYGPCIGMSRLKRWQRAQRLGLNPPIEVLAVLLKEEAKGSKGSKGIERAHMDDIMNNTTIGL